MHPKRGVSFCLRQSYSRIPLTMKILVAIHLLSYLFLAVRACTEIRVKAIIVEPKGYPRTAALPANCASNQAPLKWQHNYTVAYLNALKLPIGADGMNSAGLSVGCLLFPGFAEFQVF